MQKFTQKYVLVQMIKDLPVGYEYAMEDWPLHVTVASVCSIESKPDDLLRDLEKQLSSVHAVESKVVRDEWFGENKEYHVMLVDKTPRLNDLFKKVITVLNNHGLKFNSPEYEGEGYAPHATIQKIGQLYINDVVLFHSLTLIDMFPDENPHQRRVLGTIH